MSYQWALNRAKKVEKTIENLIYRIQQLEKENNELRNNQGSLLQLHAAQERVFESLNHGKETEEHPNRKWTESSLERTPSLDG